MKGVRLGPGGTQLAHDLTKRFDFAMGFAVFC